MESTIRRSERVTGLSDSVVDLVGQALTAGAVDTEISLSTYASLGVS